MSYTNYWEHTFHNAATVAANGTAFEVKGRKSITVEIYSTEANTARTVTFYGKCFSGISRLIPGCKISGDTNYTIATSTTGTGEIYIFDDIEGLEYIIMDLTSVTGGSVTVKGRVN